MHKEIAKELKSYVNHIANRYSKKDREGNYNNEKFSISDIIPTSDNTAVVYFKKNTGKVAVGFFYYINRGMSKGWKYYFPTDSHINGMQSFLYYKLEAERINYKHNFK